jgi:hypothetical protein
MTPTQLVLKLYWDSERPASSDFTLGKRKKFTVKISRDSRIEVAVWTW